MTNPLNVLLASMEALRTTLGANTEAVLHDLTQPACSIVSIVNGHVSGRKVGDALLTGPDEDKGFMGMLEPAHQIPFRVYNSYQTKTISGKVLNSASTIYYNEKGVPVVAFCMNVDTDIINKLQRDLAQLLPDKGSLTGKKNDVPPIQSLDEIIASFRKTGAETNIQYRKRVVAELYAMGFFKVKGSVNHIARVLGVSRYTIYNYLEKKDE